MHGKSRTNRRSHRLFDDVDLARTCRIASVLHRTLLHTRDARGHTDDEARLGEVTTTVHLLDEVAKHALGGVEVGDNAVLQRTDRNDVARGATDHALGVCTDRKDAAGVLIDRHHGGLIEDNATAADIDKGVGGAEVNGHIATDERHVVRHENPSSSSAGLS